MFKWNSFCFSLCQLPLVLLLGTIKKSLALLPGQYLWAWSCENWRVRASHRYFQRIQLMLKTVKNSGVLFLLPFSSLLGKAANPRVVSVPLSVSLYHPHFLTWGLQGGLLFWISAFATEDSVTLEARAWRGLSLDQRGGSGVSLDTAVFLETAGGGLAVDGCCVSFGGCCVSFGCCCHSGWEGQGEQGPLQSGSQPGSWSGAGRPALTLAASPCRWLPPNTKGMGITLCSSLLLRPGTNPLLLSNSGLYTLSTCHFV